MNGEGFVAIQAILCQLLVTDAFSEFPLSCVYIID